MRHPSLKTILVCRNADLAVNGLASADSVAANALAHYALTGEGNGWAAADDNGGHYWRVDLGSVMMLHGILLKLPASDVAYGYSISYSTDGATWSTAPVRYQTTPGLQFQDSNLTINAQYVMITFDSADGGVLPAPDGLLSVQMF